MSADKAGIIRDLFVAYLRNDRKAVEDAFTDDFTFTSPFDDGIDKADLVRAAAGVSLTGSRSMILSVSPSMAIRLS